MGAWARRFRSIPDRLFWPFLMRRFQRHLDVSDRHTNEAVGAGYGMARTVDVTRVYLVLRSLRRQSANGVAVDLGCGDGVVLRLMRWAGYVGVWGVEASPTLAGLAIANEPSARVIIGSYSQVQVLEEVGAGEPVSLVYAFNPGPAAELNVALHELTRRGQVDFVYRNPTHWEDIQRGLVHVRVLRSRTRANILVARLEWAGPP